MNTASFNKEVEFDDNRVKTKVLIETTFSKEIRILLKQGQMMKEHKAPYPILVHILDGVIEFGAAGTIHLMKTGDIISIDANIPHNLNAMENSIVRLTLSKLDKFERVKEVVNG